MQDTQKRKGPRFPDAVITLSEDRPNAFEVLGEARSALRDAGATPEQIEEYTRAATGDDYDHLVDVTRDWVFIS